MTTGAVFAGVRSPDPWWIVIQHPAHIPLPINVVERGRWYRREMKSARLHSQLLDVSILVATAAVPCVVAVHAPGWSGAILGGLAAVGTGLRQVFGWQRNWASYTRANVQIESEIVRFGQGVGEYAPPATAAARLATRVEDITASETGSWAKSFPKAADSTSSSSSSADGSYVSESAPST